jgi:hypothetical protein
MPGSRESAMPAPKQASAPTIKTDRDAHPASAEIGALARGRMYPMVEAGPEVDAERLIGGRLHDEAGGSRNPSRNSRGSIRSGGSSRRTELLFEDIFFWFEDILVLPRGSRLCRPRGSTRLLTLFSLSP